jgi:hypothetical protein
MQFEQSRKSAGLAPAAGVDDITSGFAGHGGLHLWVCFHELGVEHHLEDHKTLNRAGFFAES